MSLEDGNNNDGRFVWALLSINYAKILLACIYTPNVYDGNFLPSISMTLSRYLNPHCIISGDLNATDCSELDRSTGSQKRVPSSSLALRSFLTDLNLGDLWSIRNGEVKAYSFHSGRHGTLSRIDYIFVGPPLIIIYLKFRCSPF